MSDPAIGQAFAHVDLWIFDLDNTLYPYPPALWSQVDARMGGFISTLLEVDAIEARRVQKDYFLRYGLTMRGLMKHHGVRPEDFLAHVHDVDLADIAPNPSLRDIIAALPGRKVIHTNADRPHVGRVLGRLAMEETLFDAVYDITGTGFVPKPSREAYDIVLKAEGADGRSAAMFEDSARNLLEPHRRGMRTVLVPTRCDIASAGASEPHVHFKADDFTQFMADVAEAIA